MGVGVCGDEQLLDAFKRHAKRRVQDVNHTSQAGFTIA